MKFDLPPSVERDLLIRKLLTAGNDTKQVTSSSLAASRAMLTSIWSMRTEMEQARAAAPDVAPAAPAEKLPALSLRIDPRPQAEPLAEISESRRALAA